MRRKSILVLALLICLSLVGCGGVKMDNMTAAPGASNSGMGGDFAYPDGGNWDMAENGGAWEPMAPDMPTGSEEPAQKHDKMVYRASLDLETTAFDSAAQSLEGIVSSLGGYFENRQVSNYSTYRSGYYTIRVPAENFSALLSQVGSLCHVRNQEDSADNVSEAYYDLEARLSTQRTKLARLQELLAQAEDMEDIITIESAISDTELNIEYLTGSLRQYDSLIDYATVTVRLEEVYKLSNVEEPVIGFGGRLKNAFVSGFHTGVDVIEGILLALAYNWLGLLVLAAVIALVVVLVRRSNKKRQQMTFAPPPPMPGTDKKDP